MPYKEVRNGKTIWIGQVQWQGTQRKRVFQKKCEATEWERHAKEEATGSSREQQQMVAPKSEPKPELESQKKTPSVSLLEWTTCYLEYALRLNKKVFSDKKRELKRFLKDKRVDPDGLINQVTPDLVLAYCQDQFRRRGGKVVNNNVIKNLAAAWNYGVKYKGFPTPNPFEMIDKFPMDVEEGHYVPPEEDFWKVYDVAEGQDRVMLAALLHTAARRGEVYGLKWEDVNFDAREIALKTRKTKDGSVRKDWIPLTDDLFESLWTHRQQSNGSEYVFTQRVGRHNGKRYVENRGFPQELCEKAGVKTLGCH